MDKALCSIPNCEREIFTKKSGWCQSHYLSARRNNGDPNLEIRGLQSPAEKAQLLRDHGFEPLGEYPGPKKRWLVRCTKGHEVEVSPDRLEENQEPCGTCRHPSILETHPHLAEWWDYTKNDKLRPEDFSKGSAEKVYWKCPVGHSPLSEISVQAHSRRLRCGVCNGYQVVAGVNDLKSQSPAAALLWAEDRNNLKATEVYFASQKNHWWRCSNGHSYSSTPFEVRRSLRKDREGCPYCHNRKTWKGWNDLATVAPSLVDEYLRGGNPVPPDEICAFTRKVVLWQCENGHKARSRSVGAIVSRRSRCSVCVGIMTESGTNDALSANPGLHEVWSAAENGPVDVLEQTARSSNKFYRWKCPQYPHTFAASVSNAVRGVSCAVCGNRELLMGFNDLASHRHAHEFDLEKTKMFSEEFGWQTRELKPEQIRISDKRRVWWRCSKNDGHSWDTSLSARLGNDSGCPFCVGNRVSPGENDLATRFAELVPEWSSRNSQMPEHVAFGSQHKVWWVCLANKGHPDYQAAPKNRTGPNSTGCPDCNTGGFETSKPAYLYLIEHNEFDALKIGISNIDSRPDRLQVWESRGWTLIARWEDSYGKTIKDTEQSVLRDFIRGQLRLPQPLTKQEMGGSGQNETFDRRPGVAGAVVKEVEITLPAARATNTQLRAGRS